MSAPFSILKALSALGGSRSARGRGRRLQGGPGSRRTEAGDARRVLRGFRPSAPGCAGLRLFLVSVGFQSGPGALKEIKRKLPMAPCPVAPLERRAKSPRSPAAEDCVAQVLPIYCLRSLPGSLLRLPPPELSRIAGTRVAWLPLEGAST